MACIRMYFYANIEVSFELGGLVILWMNKMLLSPINSGVNM
jgi:hypothetical protein